MSMPRTQTDWTAERVRALPDDGKRYEVMDGELLVTPSPRLLHQRALGELLLRLAQYVRAAGIGEVFFSPSDVEFDSRTMVQPDLFVVSLNEGRPLRDWSEIQRLLLAVEILSPSTARYDRLTKRRVYQRQGVEYWIIDIDARVVERWRPGDERPEILAERLEWQLQDRQVPWVLELEDYFDAVWG
jgi:Uma2 family endonuclease